MNIFKLKIPFFRGRKLNNKGMGTVEIILIIVVLVGLVVIFKSQITALVQVLFSKILGQVDKI
ncbi:MAG: Flp1 family type IVb pilin [Lachnospiraceae bacterium]